MPAEHAHVTVDGTVADLFGHRFALSSPKGKILADLGPKGADEVRLAVGDKVALSGEQKPSEVKVHSITVHGHTYTIHHPEKGAKQGPGGEGDEKTALTALKAIGFEAVGKPTRHPRHFEIVGRRGDEHKEFHVEFDGSIRKTKPHKKEG